MASTTKAAPARAASAPKKNSPKGKVTAAGAGSKSRDKSAKAAKPAKTAKVAKPDLAMQAETKPQVEAKPQAAMPQAGKLAKPDRADNAEKAKADKARKPKLVRDSFTIPKAEYAMLAELKSRAAKLGRPTKKSEVLRAGVQALAAMGDAAFLSSIGAVPVMKTGRPAKNA